MRRDHSRAAGSSLGQRALALLLAVELAGCQTVPEVKSPVPKAWECLSLSVRGDAPYVDCQNASCESLARTADFLRRTIAARTEPEPSRPIDWGDAIESTLYFLGYFPIAIPLWIYDSAKEAEGKRWEAEKLSADRAQLADIEKLMREKRCPGTLPAPAEK